MALMMSNLHLSMKKQKVAIFDIDGTIFRSSLLIELVRALIAEGLFKPNVISGYAKKYEAWLDRDGSYQDYIDAVVTVFKKNIAGIAYADFMRVARKTVARDKNHTYRFTRDLAARLKKEGYYLLAISHSPKVILDEFCKSLGFSKVYGLIYEIDSKKRFNGSMSFTDIMLDKAKVLERAVLKENLTLRGSIGVGDTESDAAFLKLVDRPICFNPNKNLYRIAKKSGWEVVVERKDMVYEV
jgi:HAD superfamily phosphoserine phosphatase-like hydrolase